MLFAIWPVGFGYANSLTSEKCSYFKLQFSYIDGCDFRPYSCRGYHGQKDCAGVTASFCDAVKYAATDLLTLLKREDFFFQFSALMLDQIVELHTELTYQGLLLSRNSLKYSFLSSLKSSRFCSSYSCDMTKKFLYLMLWNLHRINVSLHNSSEFL